MHVSVGMAPPPPPVDRRFVTIVLTETEAEYLRQMDTLTRRFIGTAKPGSLIYAELQIFSRALDSALSGQQIAYISPYL